MLSRTAAVNWVLAETDLLSDYTKEGSQQRDSQVEQTPLGLRWKRADVYERGGRGGGDCEAEMAAMFQQKRIKRLERVSASISLQQGEDGAPNSFMSAVKSTQEPEEELSWFTVIMDSSEWGCKTILWLVHLISSANVILSYLSETPVILVEDLEWKNKQSWGENASSCCCGNMLFTMFPRSLTLKGLNSSWRLQSSPA